jgi:cystathionine gamma-lyase
MNSLNVFSTVDEYYDCDKDDKHIYCYGRVQNPTVRILEDKLAALEHGVRSYVFASGMAAATTAVLTTVKAGGHVICLHNAYGPLKNFLAGYCREHMNVETTFVEGDRPEEFETAMQDNTQLVILESPSSLLFSVQDIEAVAKIAHAHQAMVYIDNTFCTPIYQKPLDLGADIVMHTCSKYLGGHSDLIGGVLAVRDENLAKEIAKNRETFGSIIGPMEAWLMMRGLRTLEVRLKEHEKTAMAVAEFLEAHPKVAKVHYTGLASHPQKALVDKQQKGSSGLLSFEIRGTVEQAKELCERLKIFKIGVSWGGFESLAYTPCSRMSEEDAKVMRTPVNIIRIHCGLEGAENLISDLRQALDQL